jgi:hypothetical protein
MGIMGIRVGIAFIEPKKGAMVSIDKKDDGQADQDYTDFFCLPDMFN